MALYIPHSIFHLARLLYVRPDTFGPYYVLERLGTCYSKALNSLTHFRVLHRTWRINVEMYTQQMLLCVNPLLMFEMHLSLSYFPSLVFSCRTS